MKRRNFGMLGLRAQLACTRFGASNSVAFLLCLIGSIVWLWPIPYLHAQSTSLQHSLKRAQQSLHAAENMAPAAQLPTNEEHLKNFYDALGEKRYPEQQVKTLFAVARKNNLTLHQAEYRASFDKNGGFHTYQILLPVKGSYSAIRQFCEQTLIAIPFASLDEINFKRDTIANRTLEAKLRFTLYLADPGKIPVQAFAQDAKP